MKPDIRNRLLAPGPVPIRSSTLNELAKEPIHHRTPEFTRILNESLRLLKLAFDTSNSVQILTSTGSGAMEAAVVNTLSAGDEILVLNTGKFGERWVQLGEVYGCSTHSHKTPWGEAFNLDQVIAEIQNIPKLKAVLCQATETSTAVWNPIEQLGAWLKQNRPEVLFIVDGITAVLTAPIKMDQWNIDVLVSGSQKAFALPTGLSFISLSEKAWKSAAHSTLPKYYFDLKRELKANQSGQTFFSSSVSMIRGLHSVLLQFEKEGFDLPVFKCQRIADMTREALNILNLKIYSHSPSPALTAFCSPEGIDGAKLRSHIESKYKITFMGGQDELAGKIIRIGHLGDISKDDLFAAIYFLGQGLKDFGFEVSDSQIEKASQIVLDNWGDKIP